MATNDPAVRSVRIAVALSERFVEILHGPSQAVSFKKHGALIGVAGNQEALSMRIGEAQQIYPEIWRHLDEARAAFASRGVDVSEYDRIRAVEGPALGAAVDTERKSVGTGQHGYDQFIKSANFNRVGYERVRGACAALMRATPDVPWAEIARTEAADPNIAAFTRATRRKRWIRLALLAAVIAAPFAIVLYVIKRGPEKHEYRPLAEPEAPQLGDGERAKLDAAVAKAREAIAAARRAWPAATTREALAAAAPGSQPCEHAVQAPTDDAARHFVEVGTMDAAFGPRAFDMYRPDATIPDERLAALAGTVDLVADRAAAGRADRSDLERLASLPTHLVLVIADRLARPTGDAPGELVGRGYVFSIAGQRLVCAGAIDAKASAEDPLLSRVRGSPAPALVGRVLEVRFRQALAGGLRALR